MDRGRKDHWPRVDPEDYYPIINKPVILQPAFDAVRSCNLPIRELCVVRPRLQQAPPNKACPISPYVFRAT